MDIVRSKFVDITLKHAWNMIRLLPGTTDADLEELATLMQACAYGKVASVNREVVVVSAEGIAGQDGAYPSYLDMMTLDMRVNSAIGAQITIPTPKSTLFAPDNETVDLSSPAVDALVQWLVFHGAAVSGLGFTSVRKGWRWRMPTP